MSLEPTLREKDTFERQRLRMSIRELLVSALASVGFIVAVAGRVVAGAFPSLDLVPTVHPRADARDAHMARSPVTARPA